MNLLFKGLAVTAAGVAAAAAGRVLTRPPSPNPTEWYALTIDRPSALLSGPDRPEELKRLAEECEMRLTAAPGGRGTEAAVRSSRADHRERLRAVKQRIETGEVLRVEGQTEGRRTATGRFGLPLAKRLMRGGIR
ncbi:hypothetical protein [Streptosporangium sp. LJ11]|uniref:hypothetical protein n=1 Tax=Streptosporangium sp. LJ11 TaxID=3436927 RepID=UPI003F7A7A9E